MTQRLKNYLRYFFLALGACIWVFEQILFFLVVLMALIANKLNPEALDGNCWSYALPKFWKYNGYLALRPAVGQKFLGHFPIYHVVWIKEFGRDNKVEQLSPVNRKFSSILPWYVFYFQGRVNHIEVPRNAKEL